MQLYTYTYSDAARGLLCVPVIIQGLRVLHRMPNSTMIRVSLGSLVVLLIHYVCCVLFLVPYQLLLCTNFVSISLTLAGCACAMKSLIVVDNKLRECLRLTQRGWGCSMRPWHGNLLMLPVPLHMAALISITSTGKVKYRVIVYLGLLLGGLLGTVMTSWALWRIAKALKIRVEDLEREAEEVVTSIEADKRLERMEKDYRRRAYLSSINESLRDFSQPASKLTRVDTVISLRTLLKLREADVKAQGRLPVIAGSSSPSPSVRANAPSSRGPRAAGSSTGADATERESTPSPPGDNPRRLSVSLPADTERSNSISVLCLEGGSTAKSPADSKAASPAKSQADSKAASPTAAAAAATSTSTADLWAGDGAGVGVQAVTHKETVMSLINFNEIRQHYTIFMVLLHLICCAVVVGCTFGILRLWQHPDDDAQYNLEADYYRAKYSVVTDIRRCMVLVVNALLIFLVKSAHVTRCVTSCTVQVPAAAL